MSWRQIFSEKMRRQETLNKRMFDAILTNKVKDLEKSLKQGADPNSVSENKLAPIHLTTETDNYEMVSILLKSKKIQLNQRTDHYLTPIILACTFNNHEILELLLKNGANPNATDLWGRTPLLMATRFGYKKLIEILIDYKGDVNKKDCFDNTPLSTCLIDKPNMGIAKLLLDNGADVDYSTTRLCLFFELIMNTNELSRIDYVLLLLDHGVDINTIDRFTGRNCLHFVAISGYYPLAFILINRGADINVPDRMNRTPIMIARDHYFVDILKLFRFFAKKGISRPLLIGTNTRATMW